MATKAKSFVPEGSATVNAYLSVRNAAAAIEFYKRAFGAREVYRLPMPGGVIGHAELRILDTLVMLADEAPEFGNKSPATLGGSPVGFSLYVEDCDAFFKRALEAGGREVRPVADQFYGDRSGTLVDPFGFQWTIATHKEDMTPEEMAERMARER